MLRKKPKELKWKETKIPLEDLVPPSSIIPLSSFAVILIGSSTGNGTYKGFSIYSNDPCQLLYTHNELIRFICASENYIVFQDSEKIYWGLSVNLVLHPKLSLEFIEKTKLYNSNSYIQCVIDYPLVAFIDLNCEEPPIVINLITKMNIIQQIPSKTLDRGFVEYFDRNYLIIQNFYRPYHLIIYDLSDITKPPIQIKSQDFSGFYQDNLFIVKNSNQKDEAIIECYNLKTWEKTSALCPTKGAIYCLQDYVHCHDEKRGEIVIRKWSDDKIYLYRWLTLENSHIWNPHCFEPSSPYEAFIDLDSKSVDNLRIVSKDKGQEVERISFPGGCLKPIGDKFSRFYYLTQENFSYHLRILSFDY